MRRLLDACWIAMTWAVCGYSTARHDWLWALFFLACGVVWVADFVLCGSPGDARKETDRG